MPKAYTQLAISGDEALNEKLIGILSQLGFEGFWEEGTLLRCYIGTDRWNNNMLEEVHRVTELIRRSSHSRKPSITVSELEEKNWNEEWEKTIRPIRVGERIVITPTWHRYEPTGNELVLTIDPKMSFGTGYHETTRLVLRVMEQTIRQGMKLLDVGTGTGILAIAGVKLGAKFAIGVDTDEWSFENARENVKLNAAEHQVTILLGELDAVPMQTFDMIVANIQRNVLEPILPELRSRLAHGGILVLSGLLQTDEMPMRSTLLANGYSIHALLSENEWIAIVASIAHTSHS